MTSKLIRVLRETKTFNDKYNIGTSKFLKNVQQSFTFDGASVNADYFNTHYGLKGIDAITLWSNAWKNTFTRDHIFFSWEMKKRPFLKDYSRKTLISGYDVDELGVPEKIYLVLDKTMDKIIEDEELICSTILTNFDNIKKEMGEKCFSLL